MTLDPTIEARVRAKRAHPLDQDADVLALLDEVERLRVRAARCDVPDCAGGWAMAARERERERERARTAVVRCMVTVP